MILAILFTLITAVLASPVDIAPYPPYLTSKGFRLVINVTDLTKDFHPSINGHEIAAFHLQSSFHRATATEVGNGNIFYQYPHVNDSDRFSEFQSMLLTELGPNTAGLQQDTGSSDQYSGPKYNMTMNFGEGTRGVQLAVGGYFAYVRPFEFSGAQMSFVVCNETVEWYSRNDDEKLLALDYLSYSGSGPDFGLHVPRDCVPVRLLAQCDKLPEVANGTVAYPLHQLAQEVRCYEDVKAIDWSKYVFRP
ncbi:hypothetical protein GQ53DRAFT_847957 [Thozetella sp. PMI_491]|nr:hypothetical protein GQ53DRAFT_847957 [Thozetella sp. PMI_491]